MIRKKNLMDDYPLPVWELYANGQLLGKLTTETLDHPYCSCLFEPTALFEAKFRAIFDHAQTLATDDAYSIEDVYRFQVETLGALNLELVPLAGTDQHLQAPLLSIENDLAWFRL